MPLNLFTQPLKDFVLGTTDLIFSRPWGEAIDLYVPVTDLNIHALNIRKTESSGSSILKRCEEDPKKCPIGENIYATPKEGCKMMRRVDFVDMCILQAVIMLARSRPIVGRCFE